jgi:hypothetical protein
MFLDSSASSSPSKSPMHYAHTDGGVSAIRCLDQSVDEPPDSPARAPTRCLRGLLPIDSLSFHADGNSIRAEGLRLQRSLKATLFSLEYT